MGLVHRVLPDAELEGFVDGILHTLSGERAAGDRQLEDHHRGVREVGGIAGPGTRCAPPCGAAPRAPTTRKAGARSWKSASRASRGNELKIKSIRVRAVAVPMKRPLAHQHRGGHGRAAAAHRPADRRRHRRALLPVQPRQAPPAGRSRRWSRRWREMLKGDAVAPFDIEKKLRARYTLLGVHNIVLFAMSGIDMAAWDALGQSLEPAAGAPARRDAAADARLQLQGPRHSCR